MMTLENAAQITAGQLAGPDAVFEQVEIDSRQLTEHSLFVAIPGERFDGHDFVAAAKRAGAAGAMVSRAVDCDLPQVVVEDTTLSLGVLAHHWRQQFDLPLVAITGSNGKTTVTAMVAEILQRCGPCLFPRGSFNNQWGVPLTLLKLRMEHCFAVIEMGTNHAGEIEYLSDIARPRVAAINNVGPAHLEGLGDTDQVSRAKAEIFSGLTSGGIAVLNADDRYFSDWQTLLKERSDITLVTFGLTPGADVTASEVECLWDQSHFTLQLAQGQHKVSLPLPGRHNVMNALAAATIAQAAGAPDRHIVAGLQSGKAVQGRLSLKTGRNDSVVIDDSYNANPQSIKAGIDVVSRYPGKKLLVLGAMAELGNAAASLHREVGTYAREQGIDQLFCLVTDSGKISDGYVEGFGDGAVAYKELDDLVNDLEACLKPQTAVLVKGSRSSRMERVVQAICENGNNNNEKLEARAC